MLFLHDGDVIQRWDARHPNSHIFPFEPPLPLSESICSIARLWDGSFYIATNAQFIRHWVPGAAHADVVAGRDGRGEGLYQLNEVSYMAIDRHGNLYMSDENNNRVLRMTSEGIITVVAGGNGGGECLNQLLTPQGVEVDYAGALFVADCLNNRVMRWDPDSDSGLFVAGGHGCGGALNQLKYPGAIALDCHGNVYVADAGNQRIVRWDPEAREGVVVFQGDTGGPIGQLCEPTDIAIIDGSADLCLIMVTDETWGYLWDYVRGAAVRLDLTTNEHEIVLRGRFGRVLVETYEAWSPQVHARFPGHFGQPASLIALVLRRHEMTLDIIRLVTGYVLGLHWLTRTLYRVLS